MKQQLFKGRGAGTELGPGTVLGLFPVLCSTASLGPGEDNFCASQPRRIQEKHPEKRFSWRENNGKQKAGDVLLSPLCPQHLKPAAVLEEWGRAGCKKRVLIVLLCTPGGLSSPWTLGFQGCDCISTGGWKKLISVPRFSQS